MSENEIPPAKNITPDDSTRSRLFLTLIRVMVIAGVLSVAAGVINLFAALTPSLAPETSLADGLFNISMGVLLVICSRLLTKGKALAIWLFGTTILYSIGYSYAIGRGINYLIALASAFIIWQLLSLKKKGELR